MASLVSLVAPVSLVCSGARKPNGTLVLNQTTEHFQEMLYLSLVTYKSKLNKTGMNQCIFAH